MGTYDFSSKSAFKNQVEHLDEKNAKETLRILVDFLKTETDKTLSRTGKKSLTYEPFLTNILELRENSNSPQQQEEPDQCYQSQEAHAELIFFYNSPKELLSPKNGEIGFRNNRKMVNSSTEMRIRSIINVASIEKNFLKNQFQKEELLVSNFEVQTIFLDFKGLGKKIHQKYILQTKKQPAESPQMKRRMTLKRQNTRPSNSLLDQANIQQIELYQNIAEETENLNEMLSNLCRESQAKTQILKDKIQFLKDKLSDALKQRTDFQKLYTDEIQESLSSQNQEVRRLRNEIDTYVKMTLEYKERLKDAKTNLDRCKKQIEGYQSTYQDIDLDALHERMQFLQTKNISFQHKIGFLTQQINGFAKQATGRQSILFRQNNLYEKLLAGMDNTMQEFNDEDEDNQSDDNAQVFLQNDEQDTTNLPPEKLQEFVAGQKLLSQALAKKGLNLSYELKLNGKNNKQFKDLEMQIM
ncbi:UNKNOWN [Stylonychia lemnae]|uniref:Uncharacterized protein n=1 Tax=Stylonychia lemnae TaxID=5949 RepID=A0A078A4J9_STYLE|nr:UNKNOWN [Stylonychia lemnae]|eukprot:CDW75689.1 UNKNOWN [Stylonychia lemnae]